MKNLKSKIRDFLNSEEGRVGVKTPLALGVATGGLLLAQAMVATPAAQADECSPSRPCPHGKDCKAEWSKHLVDSYVCGSTWENGVEVDVLCGIYKWRVHNVCK